MIYFCAISGCTNNSNTGVTLRNFPSITSPEFKEWIKATKNKSLENLTPEYIKRSKRVCNIHFSKSYQQKSAFRVQEMQIPTENLPSDGQDVVRKRKFPDEQSKPEEFSNKIEGTKQLENINIEQKKGDVQKDEVVHGLKQFLNFKNNIKTENNYKTQKVEVPHPKTYLGKLCPKKVKLEVNRMVVKIPENAWKSNACVNITNFENKTKSIKAVDSQKKRLNEMENVSVTFKPENRREFNEIKIINGQYDFELGQTQVIDNNSVKPKSYVNDGLILFKVPKKKKAPEVSTTMVVDETIVTNQKDLNCRVNETNSDEVNKMNEYVMKKILVNKMNMQHNKNELDKLYCKPFEQRQTLNQVRLMNIEKEKLKLKKQRQLQRQVYYLKKRVDQYKEQLKEFQQFQKLDGFVQRFFKTQLNNAGHKNKGQTYTLEDKMFAYSIYSRSRICYKYLAGIFCLPSTPTIDRFYREVQNNAQLNAINDLKRNDYLSQNCNTEVATVLL
ncbi:PREDICTED: uncharacterized protein LOC108564010 [Nicrophorus vespilloides]|uniref:Uncharacterized protein LOC108564010 n=1 Tax=Nicrophorus vespilloides TaxID=110193 RepID=A0ABM1MUW9_NICVS|nr:PREDICTED: uncharacterized protein LOC108564010 [Nicrophorus vespilloides]